MSHTSQSTLEHKTPEFNKSVLNNGNPQGYALAGIGFILGYYIGKGDRQHWKDVARSADSHWHKEHGWHDDHHGHYTHREHERDNNRRGHERG